MVFANWALVIATMVLALITFFYMRHTRGLAEHTNRLACETKRMADTMAQEFELRIAPFIWVDELPSTRGTDVREYHPTITNRGFRPVRIMKIVLEGWPKESSLGIFRKETRIDKVLGSNESIPFGNLVIQLKKSDVSIDALEEGKDFDFNQLLNSSQGKIYFIYEDRNGREQRTGDQYYEHL